MNATLRYDFADTLPAVRVESDLGALQSEVKALMKAIAYVDADAPRLEKQACAAWRKKDQKALAHARSVLVDWLAVRDDVAALKGRVEGARDAWAELDGRRNAAIERMVGDLEHAGDSVRRLDETVRVLVALGDVPNGPRHAALQPQTLTATLCDLVKLPFASQLALADA